MSESREQQYITALGSCCAREENSVAAKTSRTPGVAALPAPPIASSAARAALSRLILAPGPTLLPFAQSACAFIQGSECRTLVHRRFGVASHSCTHASAASSAFAHCEA
eukprot:712663-Pleurochrysis_carterae.AAC.1